VIPHATTIIGHLLQVSGDASRPRRASRGVATKEGKSTPRANLRHGLVVGVKNQRNHGKNSEKNPEKILLGREIAG
jgi:hypothetical protein